MTTKLRIKAATAALAGALIVGSGIAAAALPGAASTVAAGRLAAHGIAVKGPNAHAGTHPETRGKSADHAGGGTEADSTDTSHGKGAEISALAHSTTLTGVAKGAAISTLASDGHSHAGMHGTSAGGSARADLARNVHSVQAHSNNASATGQAHRH